MICERDAAYAVKCRRKDFQLELQYKDKEAKEHSMLQTAREMQHTQ